MASHRPSRNTLRDPKTSQNLSELETGIGGVKPPKIRGGGEILNFQGPLKVTPFYRDSIEIVKLGVKSPSLRGATFGAGPPPPSSVRYVLTPPSRSPIDSGPLPLFPLPLLLSPIDREGGVIHFMLPRC